MRKTTDRRNSEKTSRVRVDKLHAQEKELKDHEANRVKGGGGVVSGVGNFRKSTLNTIGEEIPS